ncbi:MAG: hypothetical protein H0U60_02470 [Blastocatellia bacterium]|nr:hypothetical protein [Blastocatellia bacterium]
MLKLSVKLKNLDKAQRKNLKVIAALRPEGALGKMAQYGAVQAYNYMHGIVHVDTGLLKMSLFIDRKNASTYAVRVRENVSYKKKRPAVYGAYENARGGAHAFVNRTMQQAPRIGQEAALFFTQEIERIDA